MALAAITMFSITSCNKDNSGDTTVTESALNIRIAKVKGENTRSVENPASNVDGTLQLVNGVIFICDASGNITEATSIVPGSGANGIQSAEGQVYPNYIKTTSTVYIAANIPSALSTKWTTPATLPATISAVNAELVSIDNADHGQNYEQATLANIGGVAQAIVVSSGGNTKATVDVGLNPVYSRIELGSVKVENAADDAGNTINSFDITGVYVTDFYPSYTVGGSYGETMYDQKLSTDFSPVISCMKDEATWSSVEGIVKPDATTKVWAYNTPSGNLPRLILRITNIDGTIGGSAADPARVYYLTITTYSKIGNPITIFERGKVYRISELKFDASKLGEVPNSNRITLSVSVDITEWVIEDIDAGI